VFKFSGPSRPAAAAPTAGFWSRLSPDACSLHSRKPGDRMKTNRRDPPPSCTGCTTVVWVPDERHEAMRDLVRAREAAHRSSEPWAEWRDRTRHASVTTMPHEILAGMRRLVGGYKGRAQFSPTRILVEAAWSYRHPARDLAAFIWAINRGVARKRAARQKSQPRAHQACRRAQLSQCQALRVAAERGGQL
jgi:hypothetical protein